MLATGQRSLALRPSGWATRRRQRPSLRPAALGMWCPSHQRRARGLPARLLGAKAASIGRTGQRNPGHRADFCCGLLFARTARFDTAASWMRGSWSGLCRRAGRGRRRGANRSAGTDERWPAVLQRGVRLIGRGAWCAALACRRRVACGLERAACLPRLPVVPIGADALPWGQAPAGPAPGLFGPAYRFPREDG